jgi:AraC-like DNA-binding protein
MNTGQTFKEILQTLKLNKAIELLTSSGLKIEDIRHSIGYENVSQLIRIFKRVYGVSPNQYRKQVTILINS